MRRGFWAGVWLVLCPPVGLYLAYRVFRPYPPRHGEASESDCQIIPATGIATRTIEEPRRPREREPWTKFTDYALWDPNYDKIVVRQPPAKDGIWDKKHG